MANRNTRRWVKIALGLAVLLFVLTLLQVPMGRFSGRPVRISPGTTYVTGPELDRGGVDYLAALNTRLGLKIDTDENAFVDLVELIGIYHKPGYQCDQLSNRIGQNLKVPIPYVSHSIVNAVFNSKPDDNSMQVAIELDCEFNVVLMRPWSAKDFPDWATVVESQDRFLDAVVQATRKPEYFAPLVGFPDHPYESIHLSKLTFSEDLHSVVADLRIRAMFNLGRGKTADAIEDVKALRRVASFVGRSPDLGSIPRVMWANKAAVGSENSLMQFGQLTREQLRDYKNFLARLPDGLDLSWRIENYQRLTLLDVIQHQALYDGKSDYDVERIATSFSSTPFLANLIRRLAPLVDWNAALREANRLVDMQAQASAEPNDLLRWQKIKTQQKEMLELLWRSEQTHQAIASLLGGPRSRGRWMAKCFFTLTSEDLQTHVTAEICGKVQDDLSTLGFALELYWTDHGHYPAKLVELQPRYVDEIPADRFTNAPLVYEIKDSGYKLYSVGPVRLGMGVYEPELGLAEYGFVFQIQRSKKPMKEANLGDFK